MLTERPLVNKIINMNLRQINLGPNLQHIIFVDFLYGIKGKLLKEEKITGPLKEKLLYHLDEKGIEELAAILLSVYQQERSDQLVLSLLKENKIRLPLLGLFASGAILSSFIHLFFVYEVSVMMRLLHFGALSFSALSTLLILNSFKKKVSLVRKSESTVLQGKLYCQIYDYLNKIYTEGKTNVAG